MISVRLQGGLGNQMFQYAYGRSREIAENVPVCFDLSGLSLPRSYALDPFDLPIQFAPANEDTLAAYWQSEKYFNHHLIRGEFLKLRPPILPFHEEIFSHCVAVHVRLTDNLSERALAFHGNLLETDYYNHAMTFMRERITEPYFLIFSDDPDWCQKHLPWSESDFGIVQGNKPHEDIWEMSRCPHAIIANSSFSWWGAWLGPQKIVCAPKRWFVVPVSGAEDIVPERWVKL